MIRPAIGVESGIAGGRLVIGRPDPHAHGDADRLSAAANLRAQGWPPTMSTSVRPSAGHAEHRASGRRGQPVDHDRAEDRHEHDREDLVRACDPFCASRRAERGRGRAGDDAARGHPGNERPLVRW